MISQLLRKKILELTKEEELCSQVLARIRLKKEKLILLLYETEDDREFSLELFQRQGVSLVALKDTPADKLTEDAKRSGANPLGQEELDSLTSLKLVDRSIENLTSDSKELTRQLRTEAALSEDVTMACQGERFDPETVADLILDQIKKMQLWSFGTTYMAQILNLESDIVSQSLRLESYSSFWQLKKKAQRADGGQPELNSGFRAAKTDTLETWITDLDLINSLSSIEVKPEQKDSDSPTSEKKEGLRKGRSQRAFKRSLPPNSTDDLVEKSSSVMDLLNKVFDSNRGKQLDAIGILDYLYPGQTKDWSKKEKRFRVQLVSRELCTSIERGNWRRISVGVYLHA